MYDYLFCGWRCAAAKLQGGVWCVSIGVHHGRPDSGQQGFSSAHVCTAVLYVVSHVVHMSTSFHAGTYSGLEDPDKKLNPPHQLPGPQNPDVIPQLTCNCNMLSILTNHRKH